MNLKRVIVSIKVNLQTVPDLEQILPQEQALVARWKEQDILEHLFLNGEQGAILIFKDIDINKTKELVSELPLAKYVDTIEYVDVEKIY